MIRHATEKDIEAIADMSMEFWKETSFDVPADRESVIGFAEHCLSENLLCVLEIGGNVEGFAAGIKGYMLGNVNIVCGNEVAWWVNPSHRGGRNGIKLLKYIEQMAKDAGVRFWTMAFMQSSMPEQIESIYQKLGYYKTEVLYTKELK